MTNCLTCKKIAVFILLFIATQGFSQTSQQTKHTDSAVTWGIKISGFVRNNVFYDSRQVVSARPAVQGDLLLYPLPASNDVNGKDINASPSLSMLAIDSRLSVAITGPDAFGAKTSGVLEAEFFGNISSSLGTTTNTSGPATNSVAGTEDVFRLRHAYVKLDWGKTQLIFGQYWHPLLVQECMPGVLSINTGIPFQPFSRNPQIRLTQKVVSELSLIFVASSQIESFVSQGSSTNVALGSTTASPLFIDNAVIPNLSAQVQFKKGIFLGGATIDYKELRPALSQFTSDTANCKTLIATTETVKSLSYAVFAKVTTKPIVVKAEFVAGQNLYDQIMIGGYLAYATTAPYHITYKPLNVASVWLDIAGTSKKVVPGIFFGYTKNNGADEGAVASYSRGITAGKLSIDKIIRVTPRIEFYSGKFKIGAELEFTQATYGTAGNNGKVSGSTYDVANYRALFVTAYYF